MSIFFGHTNVVYFVCFSPDGNTLASGTRDKSIRLWDVKTGLKKELLDGHSSLVYSACFSPDGNTLATCSRDKSHPSLAYQDRKIKKQIEWSY